jgi:hypothetical protein
MSTFTCPGCEDGQLEAKVREVDLELEEGETAQIVAGVVLITSVGCNNGCDDHHEEKKPKRQKGKNKDHAPAASGDACARSELCSKSNGHKGRCDSKLAERVDA